MCAIVVMMWIVGMSTSRRQDEIGRGRWKRKIAQWCGNYCSAPGETPRTAPGDGELPREGGPLAPDGGARPFAGGITCGADDPAGLVPCPDAPGDELAAPVGGLA